MKLIKKINFALIGIMIPMFAFAETKDIAVDSKLCEVITSLQDVFKTLRILAFIGAAFFIMRWAWEYISAGDVDLAKAKKQGVSLIVGFSLLLLVGILAAGLSSAAGLKFVGCDQMFSL